jgi:Flp pilus assembly protein TadG
MPGKRFRISERERGSVLIEFALVLPLLLVLTFMVMDFARAFHYHDMLYAAARQGARTFAVSPSLQGGGADTTSIYSAVHTVYDASGAKISSITTSGPDGSVPNQTVTVTVKSTFNWMFPGLIQLLGVQFANPMTLTASCTMRYERSS